MTRPRLGIQQALLNALVFAFFSSSICVMAKSPASSVLPFNGFECSKKIEERLIKENTLQPWIFQGPSYDGESYRARTMKFGTWVELAINKERMVTLYVVTNRQKEKVIWDSTCKQTTSRIPGLDFRLDYPDKSSTFLDDQMLNSFLQKHKIGLIYIWSPEMVYSTKYMKTFRSVSKNLGIHFIQIIDPRASLQQIVDVQKIFALPEEQIKLNSVELFMRNMTVHYPSALFFKNGWIDLDPIVGVYEPEDLIKVLRFKMENSL